MYLTFSKVIAMFLKVRKTIIEVSDVFSMVSGTLSAA